MPSRRIGLAAGVLLFGLVSAPLRGQDTTAALVSKARQLKADGEPQEAAAVLEQALRQSPDAADAHHVLAWVLLEQGRGEEAVEHFEAVMRLAPGTPEARDAAKALDRIRADAAQAPPPDAPAGVPTVTPAMVAQARLRYGACGGASAVFLLIGIVGVRRAMRPRWNPPVSLGKGGGDLPAALTLRDAGAFAVGGVIVGFVGGFIISAASEVDLFFQLRWAVYAGVGLGGLAGLVSLFLALRPPAVALVCAVGLSALTIWGGVRGLCEVMCLPGGYDWLLGGPWSLPVVAVLGALTLTAFVALAISRSLGSDPSAHRLSLGFSLSLGLLGLVGAGSTFQAARSRYCEDALWQDQHVEAALADAATLLRETAYEWESEFGEARRNAAPTPALVTPPGYKALLATPAILTTSRQAGKEPPWLDALLRRIGRSAVTVRYLRDRRNHDRAQIVDQAQVLVHLDEWSGTDCRVWMIARRPPRLVFVGDVAGQYSVAETTPYRKWGSDGLWVNKSQVEFHEHEAAKQQIAGFMAQLSGLLTKEK